MFVERFGSGGERARIFLTRAPATGLRQNRAWALADTAAESDALSTACMVLDEADLPEIILNLRGSIVWLQEGNEWKEFGDLKLCGNKVVCQFG